jgi:hypothetical protein
MPELAQLIIYTQSQRGVRHLVNWVNKALHSMSTESMCNASIFTDLITPHWLSWGGVSLLVELSRCEVSLSINSGDKEWNSTSTESSPNDNMFEYVGGFKNEIKYTQKPYFFTYTGLICAKKQNKKSQASLPYKEKSLDFCSYSSCHVSYGIYKN